MTQCPCGSGRVHDECCGPIIDGAPAITAEALMRSRYAAVVLGKLDHLEATHVPEIRGEFDRAKLEDVAKAAEWLGLEVRETCEGGPDDQTGTVEFVIRFTMRGQQMTQHELASFRREEGAWLYVESKMNPKSAPRRVVKVGRNDACSCGSGKKFKKCCGAG